MDTRSPNLNSCSELSIQTSEPFIGSAAQTNRFLLLENNAAWGAKALAESNIPDSVKRVLIDFQKTNPLIKVLLVHRPQTIGSNQLRLFMVSITDQAQITLEFSLDKYEDLLDLDFLDIFDHPARYTPKNWGEPLLLVCTNGRRDPCCSRLGLPVYLTLNDATKESPVPLVWQCSHVGGHRFAANLLVLPQGLLYGRVNPHSALKILRATQAGQIYLPNLRGRTAYPPAAQAAEAALLQTLDQTALDTLQLKQVERVDEQSWVISFLERSSDQLFHLGVQTKTSSQNIFESCQLDKTTAIISYVVSQL